MEAYIEFTITGRARQVVDILDPSMSPERLVAGLGRREFITTLVEGGYIYLNEPEGRTIARVHRTTIDYDDATEYEQVKLVKD